MVVEEESAASEMGRPVRCVIRLKACGYNVSLLQHQDISAGCDGKHSIPQI
jgi:hypothetical protein